MSKGVSMADLCNSNRLVKAITDAIVTVSGPEASASDRLKSLRPQVQYDAGEVLEALVWVAASFAVQSGDFVGDDTYDKLADAYRTAFREGCRDIAATLSRNASVGKTIN